MKQGNIMNFLLFLLLFASPLLEVVNIEVSIPTQQHYIFNDYNNDNFSQKVYNRSNGEITVHIENSNRFRLNLGFRIFPQSEIINPLDPEVKALVWELIANGKIFEDYFKRISSFLESTITYTDEDLPQDVMSVLVNKRANCIGYANIAGLLLDSVGIKNAITRGFYLKEGEGGKRLTPIPHRWIEISLPNGKKFFYDPQYQNFSANYLAARKDINFNEINKFTVKVIKISKKIVSK